MKLKNSSPNREIKKEHFNFQYLNFDFAKIAQELKNKESKRYILKVNVNTLGLNSPWNFNQILDINFDFSPFFEKIKYDYQKILNDVFLLSKNFYKEQIRNMFDFNNETFIQGYNKKYGLLINNGFKIYPRYFYFSDKYQNLEIKLFSSYKTKFYNTKFGNLFNYDFSTDKNFDIKENQGYVFDDSKKDDYGLKFKKIEEQKIGYSVFELQAAKENEFYRYYDFNFGIYNFQEITKDGLFPDSQWWQVQPESCSWYNLYCHFKNGAIWIVNNIPGVKHANELLFGLKNIFQAVVEFFTEIFAVWKFNPALYNTVINIFIMIIFIKIVRFI